MIVVYNEMIEIFEEHSWNDRISGAVSETLTKDQYNVVPRNNPL